MEICEQALKELEAHKVDIIDSLYRVVENCDSPIQQMLLVKLCRVLQLRYDKPKRLSGWLLGSTAHYDNVLEVIIDVERDIKIPEIYGADEEANYRADLYIWLTRFTGEVSHERSKRHLENGGTHDNQPKLSEEENFKLFYPELGRIIIECDGHEFHDRTRQQASNDRRRDRNMLSAGYPVFRYTDHDIHQNLDDICHEIWLQLDTMAANILRWYEATGLSPLLNGEYLPPSKDLDVMKPLYADGSPQSIDTQLL